MLTIRIRSILWFAAGAVIVLILTAVFVGVRAGAAPGPGESTFVSVVPCRLFDTRPAPNTVGPRSAALAAGDTHTQQVVGSEGDCTIPSGATGVAMNVTIANPSARSFLTVFPADAEQPTASNLNWVGGQAPTPNKVDVQLSADGRVSLFNAAGTVNVFADVVGYYTRSGLADLQEQIDDLTDSLEASKVRTDVYHGRALQYRGGTAGGLNGCEWTSNDNRQYLPLTLPLGATILTVEARVLDTFSTSYEVAFVRERERDSEFQGYETDVLGVETGGDLSIKLVNHNLTPGVTETVDEGEIFAVRFDPSFGPSTGGDHGLCRVEITYRER